MKTEWTLSELADETGLAARTIRYYIARGLLPGPGVAGRGAIYGIQHLTRLREIQKLQREGRMLAEIAQPPDNVELPPPVSWQQYAVAEGITVNVRADLPPWRLKRVRKVLGEITARLKEETDGNLRI
jgi:DNA-binding transcriptional MerR regulator